MDEEVHRGSETVFGLAMKLNEEVWIMYFTSPVLRWCISTWMPSAMFSTIGTVAARSVQVIPSFSIPVGRTMFPDALKAFATGGKEEAVVFEAS